MTRAMNSDLDLNFRPQSYFGPTSLIEYQLDRVKGAIVREHLKRRYEEGHHDEVAQTLATTALEPEAVRQLGRVHPMLMGGNYLPSLEGGEVEVARIEINSSTFDVTCLFARFEQGMIHYRVVDEYEGATLSENVTMTSPLSLTLGEMADFFLGAWSLVSVLRMNELDLEGALGFFKAKSPFYSQFDAYCRRLVEQEFSTDPS